MDKRGFLMQIVILVVLGIVITGITFYIGAYKQGSDASNRTGGINQTSNFSNVGNESGNGTIVNGTAINGTVINNTSNQTGGNWTNVTNTGLADLIIESFNYTFVRYNVTDNSTNTSIIYYDISLTAKIKNSGGLNAVASATRFYLDETWRSAVTGALVAGESVELITTFNNWSRGDYSALVKSDWNNVIDESNENNNAATILIEL